MEPDLTGYRACSTPDGRFIVLAPDGLTIEPTTHLTLQDAQSYALKLNQWLDKKPQPTEVHLFFNPRVVDAGGPTQDQLMRTIDKLTNYA